VVNRWQVVSRPQGLAKVTSISRGGFESELAETRIAQYPAAVLMPYSHKCKEVMPS
jgi:hypothetical protein